MPAPWSEHGHASPADFAACRRELRAGSTSFFAASLLLPRGVRKSATALYAFCRQADDAVDAASGGLGTIARLRRRLDRIYAGAPHSLEADRTLADVVERFAIPRTPFEALLDGLEQDARGERHETLSDVLAYSARVAGTVGTLMTVVMDVRAPDTIARACDLGIAMQLTNIARDVGEDARMGRLYLPQSWLREAGIDPDAWLAAPVMSAPLALVVRRLLDTAQGLYARSGTGIRDLPVQCRPAIHAARLIYAEIGREVARAGFDSVSRRAVVPNARKAGLLARAALEAVRDGPAGRYPPLSEAAFLVDAVAAIPLTPPVAHAGTPLEPVHRLDERIGRTIEMFIRLEQRERVPHSQRGA